MTEENKELDQELLEKLLTTLRITVANQQIEIVELKAQLSLAESRLEKLKNSKV